MLVADNRAYDYKKRQYLEQLPLEQPQKQPQKQPEVKPRKKPKARLQVFKIAFIFSLSILIISRYAYVAELSYENRNMKEAYNQALREQTDLNVQIMKTVNLETLEKTAIEKLGMQYPDVTAQIVYVSVAAAAPDTDAADSRYRDIKDVSENKYIASIKGMLSNVLKILE
ncbi:MAG: hypothetical protein ACOZCL_08180 [Bacillota bacterium]